ncbi:MAG: hypothetical protein V3V17_03200 [Alphaproteobacteria bacterium]
MKRLLAAFLFAVALAPASSLAASDQFEVEAWYGEAIYDEASNEFLNCGMFASYSGGHDLYFALSGDGVFTIGVGNDAWRLDAGASYPVYVWVDDIDLGQQQANAASEDVIWILFEHERWLIDTLRSGRDLSIETAQDVFTYDLKNTFEALPRLERCVEISMAAEVDAQNPFATVEPFRDNPFAGPDPAYPTGTDPAYSAPVDREFIETVMGLLAMSDLDDFWYVDPQTETGMFSDADAVWSDGETTGAMYIIDDADGERGADLFSFFFILAEEYCDDSGGAFSYGVQDAYITPDVPARRGAGRCMYTDGNVILPLLMWKDGDLVTIVTHLSDEQALFGASQADDRYFNMIQSLLQPEPYS